MTFSHIFKQNRFVKAMYKITPTSFTGERPPVTFNELFQAQTGPA
jgi:hypothetical protein